CNALLKTIEEPPSHIVFTLATTEPHKILPTIISRCQRFDFKRVDEKDIINRLKFVLNEENKKYDEESLQKIAKLADGGMRDALSILEQCLAFDNELTIENINQVYGLLSNDKKINLIKLLLNKDMKGVLNTLDILLNSSIDLKRLTQDLIDVLKDIIIYKNTNDVDILFVLNQHDIDSIVPYILSEEAFEMIDIFMDASQHYSQTLDPKTYFELALLKICNQIQNERKIIVEKQNNTDQKYKKTTFDIKEIEDIINDNYDINEIDNEQNHKDNDEDSFLQKAEPMVETITIEDTHEQINVDFSDILNILVQAKRTVLNDIQDRWPVIRRYCYNLNTAKYASMLCDGQPVAAGENAFILTFQYQPDVNNVNYSKNYFLLKNFLREVLGKEYDFIAVLENEWPNIRKRYVDLHKKNQLPEPMPIKLHHINKDNKQDNQLSDAQKYAVDLFGDLVEFEE
ncbi:MAG: DNA polymerase III subunit gamma/tau, partial [Faecalibacillus sp.]